MALHLRSFYRRLRYGKPVVVVSGLPRSGTSMAMKMLQAGGLPLVLDEVRTADEDNPKGYYEFERVKDLASESDWSWLANTRGKGIKMISHLLKELPATLNYKVLFIHRNLREVLASQAKMLERRGEDRETDDQRMMELFENDLWKVTYLMTHRPQFETLSLHYSEVLADPLEQARQIREFLGVDLDVERMAGVVDLALYRNRLESGRS
ncbi:MAG: sulfotransferase [Thermoanaerobaculia bacterium]